MKGRRVRARDNSAAATFDLNLAPMLDMMVALVPFLLISATFITVMVIDVPLPVPVAKALQQDRNKDKRQVDILVSVDKRQGMNLVIKSRGGSVQRHRIPNRAGELDTDTLHKKLVKVKQRYPKVFRMKLNPRDSVEYNSVVRVMDAARRMRKDDPKVLIDGAETPLMFPDVVLANVMN